MAQAAGLLDQDQLSCSICLDILKDPVTIPCGHNYCMGCIKGCWDQGDHTGVYSCPQCRETFTPRPVLKKNTLLDEVVKKMKKTGLQAAPPAHYYAGPGDVECDVCTGRKCKAVKSCLVCLASYCETHLQPHYESPAFKKHNLVKATENLQEKICSCHDKALEIYCRTDQQFICYLCTIEDHRGHDTASVATARTEKQKQLGVTQSKFQWRIQEREKELQDLRQAVQSLKRSAQAAVEDSERIFTELICSIKRRCSEVKELIRNQEKAEVSRAEGHLERLEQEISELRRRDIELEQLSHTEDHIHFLQSTQSLCVPPGPGDLPSITINPHISFEAVRKCVSELKQRLEDVCKGEMSKISKACRAMGIYGCFTETREPSETRVTAADVEACPLCMKPWQNKLRLICTHAFCAACLRDSVSRVGRQCPVCLKALAVVGDQPQGQMTVKNDLVKNFSCISYNIPNGIQTEAHPNPGKPFTGIQTHAWLPKSREGEEVLKLLRRAFDQKLVFTVAATGGAADRVVYADIPHAALPSECRKPDFLQKVKAALRAKFIE
ncbi:E3 ubiquitin/ISG15 ligase TRIM25-like isoform X3 [Anguilla anguilla]|uniref:E3 ubiquitin/ISG15 ligase TRIM25-like isoform X3 n=1 Tax=Anguilla anguilla TaxID=7936 RepID=UPI0015AFC88B|nr:E3 ubiquitin/ISG15 ligase TRIM25-like isoform X3 [Anguilla anguilla]